ncbi:hypothetical protein [Flavobacterium sp. AG291]|uniref:hypothetical protein n=1 Tax=Flavobacterium sp. AG291 TaxID=2184000 RepID=UPI000E0A196C|nr:hypothetical protein [Flavobacterium sp. AG291]RDI14371.1 hypothetical protein DEU42_10263 [Flavobacterium sp. AG291]
MNDFKLDNRDTIKSGFKTPDGYFENLSERIMMNIPVEEVKVIPLYRRKPVWVTSAAAALVLSFSLILTKHESKAPSLSSVSISEDYILNQSGIEASDILANLSTDDIKELNEQAVENISDELIEENIDFEYLSNQTN